MHARIPLLIAAALAGPALVAIPARGQDATPAPGCAGVAFTDKSGDQQFGYPVVGPTGPGNPNTDVTAGFFRSDEDGLTANIQVANLDKSVQSPSNATVWYFQWDVDGATKYVSATSDGSAFSYSYGTLGTGYQDDGSTTGRAFEGKDGVLSIKVPAAAAPDGKTLTSPTVHVTNGYELVAVGALSDADDGPDTQKGQDYTVGQCSDAAPAAAAAGASAPAALGVKVAPGSFSAKKAKKGVTFTLTAKAPLTAVALSLVTPGRTVVATGALAKLDRQARVTIKPRSALKPGRYTLTITAKNAAGADVSGSYAIKVTR